MNYLLKSSKRRSKYRKPFTIALIFLGVVLLVSFLFPRFFPGVSHAVAEPAWAVKDTLVNTFTTPLSYLTSKSSLSEKNDQLEERVAELEIEAQINQVLVEENITLKRLLGREDRDVSELARVLARPPQSPFGTLVIDRSQSVGNKVTAGDAVLLGEVVESLAETSVVALYSGGEGVIEVMLDGSKTVAEAQGRGSGNFVLEVPKDAEVSVGERVVSTELDNYIVGIVEDVEDNEASTFKQVFFRVPLNISSLEWVEVVH